MLSWFLNYNITNENVVEYLLHICDRENFLGLLSMALRKKDDMGKYKYSLLSYVANDTFSSVETDLKSINVNNEKEVIDKIFDCLVGFCNINEIIEYLKKMIRQSEKFSLLFNVFNSWINSSLVIILLP